MISLHLFSYLLLFSLLIMRPTTTILSQLWLYAVRSVSKNNIGQNNQKNMERKHVKIGEVIPLGCDYTKSVYSSSVLKWVHSEDLHGITGLLFVEKYIRYTSVLCPYERTEKCLCN